MATYTLGINCTNYDSSIINKIICYIEDKSVKVEGRINSLSYTSEQVNSKLKIVANVFSNYMVESIDVIYNSETINYIPKNNIIEFNITNGTNVLIAIKVNYYSINTDYSYKPSDKNLRGGYAIISLKSPTIYEDVEANLYKPVLLTDIIIDGNKRNDVFTQVLLDNTTFIFDNIYGYDVHITESDDIEFIKKKDDSEELINSLIDGSITEISSNVKLVKYSVFSYCESLTIADLPNVTIIDNSAFSYCVKLTKCICPNIYIINRNAFYNCKLLTNIVGPKLKEIEYSAFQYCESLTSADYINVTNVGNSAFAFCSELTRVNMPLVVELGEEAFKNCSKLNDVNLPLVTSLDSTFYNCSSLSSIILPKVSLITGYAFRNCPKLVDIYLGVNELVTLGGNVVFNDGSSNTKVHVRSEQASKYTNAKYWKDLITSGRITIIGDYTD